MKTLIYETSCNTPLCREVGLPCQERPSIAIALALHQLKMKFADSWLEVVWGGRLFLFSGPPSTVTVCSLFANVSNCQRICFMRVRYSIHNDIEGGGMIVLSV